ncbi:MAG TPA: hypothetical protein VG937_39620 [Polyangiaceae bacterium]|nr:hypothetical protein [Polyangiaceae bacterium]
MRVRFLLAITLLGPGGRSAHAQSSEGHRETRDRYELSAHSETHAELFRRALLPGPNGSLVSTDPIAPLYEYVTISARDVDMAWRKDSVDLEFAAWGRVWIGARDSERRLEGDVQVASARYRHGPVWLRFGRQVVAGGAARFARFDGVDAQAELGSGFEASAYGGFTVLPRWNQRPRYEQLGAPADSLQRDEATLESAARGKYWLAGARLGWAAASLRAGLSFHEQREAAGLSRRSLGLEGRTALSRLAGLGGNAVLDLDRIRFADARLWLDVTPIRVIDVSLEYLHTQPALFLSHQSVLSVFGSTAYDEVGSYAHVRPESTLAFEGAAFVQRYDGERPGARGELAVRWLSDSRSRTYMRVAYARVLAPENGYHSLRSSLARRLSARFRATLEAYAYWYDHAIRGYRSSTVNAGTLSFDASERVSLLWGASLAHSPYASLDAQTTLRISVSLDASRSEAAR